MPQRDRTIYMPFRGLGSRFDEADLTPEYCTQLTNFDITPTGAFQNINTFVCAATQVIPVAVSFQNSVASFHELIKPDSTSVYIIQIGDTLLNATDPGSTWTTATSITFKQSRLRSVQMNSRLIFYNGTARNFYTEDGSTFSPLLALMEQGQIAGTSASAASLSDADITNWLTQTHVNTNDLVYNATKDAYAIITGVGTAAVTHTRIDASALGIGVAGSAGAPPQASGDFYRIEDLVELNIIPTRIGFDNVTIANNVGAGAAQNTSATGIYLSAISNWKTTEIRIGDYILNTTRNAATIVTAVFTSVIRTAGISTMVAGDSLVFLKSAMPIASYAHVHFNRLYMIDARDATKIRISGPGDPQDMTVDAGTLDGLSFGFGSLQSEADRAISLASYQRFFVIGGLRNLYLFEGTNPIVDVSANPGLGESTSQDFNIVGVFPQGILGPDSMISIGNDLLYLTTDGVQSISLSQDSSILNLADLSEGVKDQFIREFATCESIFHLPEKMWVGFYFQSRNVSNVRPYVMLYNYGPYLGKDRVATNLARTGNLKGGTWTKINVSAWDQKVYFVDSSSSMYGINWQVTAGGTGGHFPRIYRLAPNAAAHTSAAADANAGEYTAIMQTSWLTLDEPRDGSNMKEGAYIVPTFTLERYRAGEDVSGASITIIACAADTTGRASDLTSEHSSDQAQVSSDTFLDSLPGESPGFANSARFYPGWKDYYSEKHPLLWRGQRVRFTVLASVRGTQINFSKLNVQFNDLGVP